MYKVGRNGLTGEEVHAKVARLHEVDHLAPKDIAPIFNMSKANVYKILEAYDRANKPWLFAKKKDKRPKPTFDQLKEDRYNGCSVKKIALKYGIPFVVVKYYVDTDHFPNFFIKES